MIYVYLIIASALIARGLFYLLQWKAYRKRKDDWQNAVTFFALTVAFIVYSVETFFRHPKEIELVINVILAVYLSVTALKQFYNKK
jgi:energy-converting hydrogenase Eha subunit G